MAMPYAPRSVRSLGLWSLPELRLKVYGIQPDGGRPWSEATLDAARGYVTRDASAAARREGASSELGFAILHEGTLGTWLLANWWAHQDILCGRLALASTGSSEFESVDDRPLVACVWEQRVIGHERDAWVRSMLTAAPDPAAYLAERLADGDY